eukprot:2910343-Alexandrium_andersonii.AAC.1
MVSSRGICREPKGRCIQCVLMAMLAKTKAARLMAHATIDYCLNKQSIASEKAYFYGFDWEHHAAWREDPTEKQPIKELTRTFKEPEPAADPSDAVVAVWSDKHEHPITDLTVESYRAMFKGGRSKDTCCVENVGGLISVNG